VTHRPSRPDDAPIFILHLAPEIRKWLKIIFELEGYVAHEARSGVVALPFLQAAQGGMIVYLDPFFLGWPGNERLHDYVMSRDERTPRVWILVENSYNIERAMDRLQADSSLEVPFTGDQALASVEDAQHLLQAKRIPPSSH
jgi:DNA-binding NtrC family response regulator